MRKLEKITIDLVTKYPFLTDPIVLFNPSFIPSKDNILSGELLLEYPHIKSNQKILPIIKEDFYKVIDIYHKTKFKNLYNKVEFGERLKDFYKVVRIIEIFYDKNEYEKFNLINEYFGIDFELLEEIFSNTEIIRDFFQDRTYLLAEGKIRSLERKKINREQIAFYFEEALKFHGLESKWKVKIGEAISIIHTNFKQGGGEIIIPNNLEPRSVKDTLILIAHEIDGHCVQFTNNDNLSSGAIRYSKSESLAEGYAMYNQYLFESNIFGSSKSIGNFLYRNKIRFESITDPKKLKKYIDEVNGNGLRFFRGFSNISIYKNLKDFVYIQGLYKIIKYNQTYSNIIPLIKMGAVNFSYINKYGIKDNSKRKKIGVKELSAYVILEKFFIN